MEALQEMWSNLHQAHKSLEDALRKQDLPTIIDDLERSEKKRHTQFKWAIFLSVLTLAGLIYLVVKSAYLANQEVQPLQWLGIALLVVSVTWINGQFYYTTIFSFADALSNNTVHFLQRIREKLLLRKKLVIIGPILYVLLLAPALHFILLDFIKIIPGYNGLIGIFYGIMLALTGYIINVEQKKFDRLYGDILDTSTSFAYTDSSESASS